MSWRVSRPPVDGCNSPPIPSPPFKYVVYSMHNSVMRSVDKVARKVNVTATRTALFLQAPLSISVFKVFCYIFPKIVRYCNACIYARPFFTFLVRI